MARFEVFAAVEAETIKEAVMDFVFPENLTGRAKILEISVNRVGENEN